MNKRPLVSICSITYNHAPYIRQCLDGMLMQQTNFAFEIIINDDCSTDGTTEIIREYAEKYPEIIKPIFHDENQYQKGLRGFFHRFVFPKAQGKYIALCEGDDYWTDPLKLQKQVDFLESHPDYSLSFHNAMIHYEDGKTLDHVFAKLETRQYKRKELLETWLAPTASFVFLKDVLSSEIYKKVETSRKLAYGDLPLILSASYCGKIYGIHETMSVYRIHYGGAMQTHSSIPITLCYHQIESRKIFNKDLKPTFNDKIGRHASIALSLMRHKKFFTGIKLWWIATFHAPFDSIKWSIKYFHNIFNRNH